MYVRSRSDRDEDSRDWEMNSCASKFGRSSSVSGGDGSEEEEEGGGGEVVIVGGCVAACCEFRRL